MPVAPPLRNRPTWKTATVVAPTVSESGSTSDSCWASGSAKRSRWIRRLTISQSASTVAEVGGDDVGPGPARDAVDAAVVLDRDPVVARPRDDAVGAVPAGEEVGARVPRIGARAGGATAGSAARRTAIATRAPTFSRYPLATVTTRDRPQTLEPGHLRGRRDLAGRRRGRPEDAQRAEARGAEALLAEAGHRRDPGRVRSRSSLRRFRGDARIVRPGDEDVELGEAVELVVQVEREEELEEALERFDPELFVLSAADADEPLEHVLDLLSDIPAGKLAIADVGGVTQAADRRARARRRRRRARPRAP